VSRRVLAYSLLFLTRGQQSRGKENGKQGPRLFFVRSETDRSEASQGAC
jgi:hypothetical protein